MLTLKQIGYFIERSKALAVLVGVSLLLLTGLIDYLSGYELGLSIFYFIPVLLVCWLVGRFAGTIMAVMSAFEGVAVDKIVGRTYLSPFTPIWNISTRLVTLLVLVLLLSELKKALSKLEKSLEREKVLARQDFLTGISNKQALYDYFKIEAGRCRRHKHPITLIYLDCDNFKLVNDRYGHQTGDCLLRCVAQTLQRCIRSTDLVARVGGDEFVVVLPETSSRGTGEIVNRLRQGLDEAMRDNVWPVTFSIGSTTCFNPPETIDSMISRADQLMYTVKFSGKNAIRHEIVAC